MFVDENLKLEIVCSLDEEKLKSLLNLSSLTQKIVNEFFNFNQYTLLNFLNDKQKIVSSIFLSAYNNSRPSTQKIKKKNDQYYVSLPNDLEIKMFDEVIEVVTDFIMVFWGIGRLNLEFYKLSQSIREKMIRRANEYGWKQEDFIDAINEAQKVNLATIGGQVQYIFPNATCELYWLSYDSDEKKENESWDVYCSRSAEECISKFKSLIENVDINKEAIQTFSFIKEKYKQNIDIEQYKVFILYFNDESWS